jgi:hypothetical protein
VWQAAGLPLEPLAEGVGLFRAFDYVEAFNARPGYAGWQVGAVPGRDAHHVERVSARIARDEVREELREAMQSGSVTPRRPRSMTRATPHEVGFRPGLVLTAADLEAAGLGVPAEVAPTPAPSASASAVVAPAPVAVPAEAVPAKWWEAVLPYMVETLKAGRFSSAKEFHRALEVSSGSPGSPFEKVQGELRVRDFGQTVALKTVQNRWKEVRAAAGLR